MKNANSKDNPVSVNAVYCVVCDVCFVSRSEQDFKFLELRKLKIAGAVDCANGVAVCDQFQLVFVAAANCKCLLPSSCPSN